MTGKIVAEEEILEVVPNDFIKSIKIRNFRFIKNNKSENNRFANLYIQYIYQLKIMLTYKYT